MTKSLKLATMFSCEKLACRLSKESCGKRWKAASQAYTIADRRQSKARLELISCVGCPVGKRHAKAVGGETL